jgi:hypothetical protein
VLLAIAAGIVLGHFWPQIAVQMEPFGTGFVKLVKMMIAPIIFITVVVGIGKLTDTTTVGRIGLKAIIYFEVLTTFAMVIGLVVGHFVAPGVGLNIDPATLDKSRVATYANASHSVQDFLLGIIPDSIVGAFAKGDILPVLFFSLLFGVGLAGMGERGRNVVHFLDEAGAALFRVIGIIMRVAPLGAFGAMSFTIGRYGIGTLAQLGFLMACFYLTCALFIFIVLELVLRVTGLRLWPLLRYLREEFFIVLGTSSSEAALPSLMAKLERLGCDQPAGRPGGAARLRLQPRRHLDLLHHGHRLHHPGAEHRPQRMGLRHHHGRPAADLEGRGRHHRRRLHHPGRHPRHPERQGPGHRHRSGARDRPLHERGPRHHQPVRQLGRHRVRRLVGRGAGRREGKEGSRRRGLAYKFVTWLDPERAAGH